MAIPARQILNKPFNKSVAHVKHFHLREPNETPFNERLIFTVDLVIVTLQPRLTRLQDYMARLYGKTPCPHC
jgi:hypothetical protein